MIKNHAKQHGRSMLEVLGVLAIIGVLSITALVGFTYAMNKHRANETIYDVMLRGTNVPMIEENYYSKPSGYEILFPGLGQNSGRQGVYYPMSTKKDSGSSYYVEATGVSYRVCELILKMEPTDIDQIVVNNSVFQGDSDICGNSDGLAMRFCFGSDGTICNGTGTGGGTSSGDTGSGGDSSSGSGSESGSDSGSSCNPACDSCSVCVDGHCEVSPCPIPSCPEGQQSTGTDSCGCIIGCEDICPEVTCDISACQEEYIDAETNCPMCRDICFDTPCSMCDGEGKCIVDEACCLNAGGELGTTISNELCCTINPGCASCGDLSSGSKTSASCEAGDTFSVQPIIVSEPNLGHICCGQCGRDNIAPQAFWNGSSNQCCYGDVALMYTNGQYGCCSADSETPQATLVEGSQSDDGLGLYTCCKKGETAYRRPFGMTSCCNGEAFYFGETIGGGCCLDGTVGMLAANAPTAGAGCCLPNQTLITAGGSGGRWEPQCCDKDMWGYRSGDTASCCSWGAQTIIENCCPKLNGIPITNAEGKYIDCCQTDNIGQGMENLFCCDGGTLYYPDPELPFQECCPEGKTVKNNGGCDSWEDGVCIMEFWVYWCE